MVEIVKVTRSMLAKAGGEHLPVIVQSAGEKARRRFIEFFTAEIRNPNTREAYYRDVCQFDDWCQERGLELMAIDPVTIAAYVEMLNKPVDDGGFGCSKPSTKRKLAAIRMLFHYLVAGGVLPFNPASSVRGPKYSIKKGKTPVLNEQEARQLIESIETDSLIGLRDRALIGVMVYSFARISAVVAMNVGDYWHQGKRSFLRLHEKGGKDHEVPCHHKVIEYLDAYIAAANVGGNDVNDKAPLFRSMLKRTRAISPARLHRLNALSMIKRRATAAGLSARICCHTFRATGITNFLSNGGTVEQAQAIAAHESPRTTKLYDRRGEEISLDAIERITI
jgi:site-specific recombinase XerD